jgi:PTH1 family peptidyl-tRNA hydrolase
VHLVVGLGNPGDRYASTRHNVAWRVLDTLAARHGAREAGKDTTWRAREASIAGQPTVLLQPLTFMNLSGEALGSWRERHGREEQLLVVSDDVYLPLGFVRIRATGSSGGHRGLESIETAVGGRDYARLRVGVGAVPGRRTGPETSAALKEHVLEEFAPEELPALEETVRLAADVVECWAAEGVLSAMNRFNRRVDASPDAVPSPQEETET